MALGFKKLNFAHVPLVVGADGRRLAKRHGDTRLSQYRDQGIKSEQIIGWAAHSVGLTPVDRPLHPRSLIADFDWSKVSRHQTVITKQQW